MGDLKCAGTFLPIIYTYIFGSPLVQKYLISFLKSMKFRLDFIMLLRQKTVFVT